jgi:hypothetical protein
MIFTKAKLFFSALFLVLISNSFSAQTVSAITITLDGMLTAERSN